MKLVRTLLAVALSIPLATVADEAAIRKNLAERLPQFPKIDEVSKTPIPGVYELRIGSDIFYTDERGDHIIDGSLFDTRAKSNLTEVRINKLTAIDFSKLPLDGAITFKQGTGARKFAVFADPNCGYCKQFERGLPAMKDVTIYVFLYPILGADSDQKSRAIWCSKDPAKAWRDWMIGGTTPPAVPPCDAASLERNLALGRRHKIQGTPALVFQDGTRVPGALPVAEVEKHLRAETQQ